MHRKHVRLKHDKCKKCESENMSEFDIKSHMHRKHVRDEFKFTQCGDDLQCVQVSWLSNWSDVGRSSTSTKMRIFPTNHEIELTFTTKKKERRLVISLLVSSPVPGDWGLLLPGVGDCLCSGWSTLYQWDPGGNDALQWQQYLLTADFILRYSNNCDVYINFI